MRIFFNRLPVAGPWGGGSKILAAIVKECVFRGHEVTQNYDKKIDLIFCLDPRPDNISNYQTLIDLRNRDNCKIIQRIGDLGTHGKPYLFDLLKITSGISDALIFPSYWAKNYANFENKNILVIPNAPLPDFIKNPKKVTKDTLKIVSHHWSNNELKGFEIYDQLDQFCQESNKFSFTYIGRKPESSKFKNYIEPKDIQGLIEEIPKHDVYITASKFEAGANHVLEAMALGLPVLYHKDGGSIVEYCKDRGIMFNSFEDLVSILSCNDKMSNLIKFSPYDRTTDFLAKEYVDFFEKLT